MTTQNELHRKDIKMLAVIKPISWFTNDYQNPTTAQCIFIRSFNETESWLFSFVSCVKHDPLPQNTAEGSWSVTNLVGAAPLLCWDPTPHRRTGTPWLGRTAAMSGWAGSSKRPPWPWLGSTYEQRREAVHLWVQTWSPLSPDLVNSFTFWQQTRKGFANFSCFTC